MFPTYVLAQTQPTSPAVRTHAPLKSPDRCPHCGNAGIVKKGTRTKKLETIQLYRCRSCERVFSPGTAALHNKMYPQREILDAISTYNLGYSLAETAAKLSHRYGHKLSSSSLSRWINLYPDLSTYHRLRHEGRSLFNPPQTIRTHKLYHRQVYAYACHRPKLTLLRRGILDQKRRGDTRFAGLADFLESVPSQCPHNLFRAEDGNRGSQIDASFIDLDHLLVQQKRNVATEIAALVLPAVANNRERHEKLQRFMLANDSVTLAVEIPMWLDEGFDALERQYRIRLLPRTGSPRVITGHINFLQVRNGAIHILDYKPDARTNKPFAQLVLYALALTRRVPSLKLFDIKCAWFNENEYCEFYPRKALRRDI
jgi:transposase-like protein